MGQLTCEVLACSCVFGVVVCLFASFIGVDDGRSVMLRGAEIPPGPPLPMPLPYFLGSVAIGFFPDD